MSGWLIALIIILVLIVVCCLLYYLVSILTLAGPAIGDSFSTIVLTAEVPIP